MWKCEKCGFGNNDSSMSCSNCNAGRSLKESSKSSLLEKVGSIFMVLTVLGGIGIIFLSFAEEEYWLIPYGIGYVLSMLFLSALAFEIADISNNIRKLVELKKNERQ